MSMSLQAEGVAGYQAANAAMYPSLRQAQSLLHRVDEPAQPKTDGRLDVPLSELTFRHLQTAEEIASIVHLRKEIQLVAAGVADPAFMTREKKETRRALSPLSSARAPSSGRFASFQ
jgi:hypothetical protein